MIKVIFSVGGQQVVFIYNKNTPTTQAKTCMKSGRFLGGGAGQILCQRFWNLK